MVTLSVAIGNLDLHAKNLSLLHPADGTVHLTPAYDVVPQAHHPGDGRLALAVNGAYRLSEVERADLVDEFTAWGLRRADNLVGDALDQLVALIEQESPLEGAAPSMPEQIRSFAENLREGRATGVAR